MDMKRLTFFLAAAAACGTVLGVPAKPGLRPYVQPDGSVVMVERTGDETSPRWVDASGNTLYETSDGMLRPWDSDAVSLLPVRAPRRQQSSVTRSSEGGWPGLCPTSFPLTGECRGLVILVAYSDVMFNLENPADYFDRMLNEEGFSDYGGTGSARDFFVENSMGRFRPQFDVLGPVTLPRVRSYYGANDRYGYDLHPEDMAIHACQILDDEVDFSVYDQDGDGFIDNVFIFYADLGEATYGPMGSVWPHSADVMDTQDTPWIFDGVRLNHYACTNETVTPEGEPPRPDGIGTFVHEFSHVLGLPDLYSTVYNGAFTPGAWSTLAEGPYNNDGRTPPLYSAYERFALGWLEPEMMSVGECGLLPLGESNRCVMASTERPEEYFLFEYRPQRGWDAYLPGEGMLVWHVDYDEKAWYDNTVNNVASHQRVDLVEADNILNGASVGGDPFPGDNGITSFGASTQPAFVSWSGLPTGYDLDGISLEDDMIRFTVLSQAGVGSVGTGGSWRMSGDVLTAGERPVSVYSLSGTVSYKVLSGESRRLSSGIWVVRDEDRVSRVSVR